MIERHFEKLGFGCVLFISDETMLCTKCGENKSIHDFHRDSKKSTGYKSKCKLCRAEEWKELSKKINRTPYHQMIDLKRKLTCRVGKPPCEMGCVYFNTCADQCRTCIAYRNYTSENQFIEDEIGIELKHC